MRNRRLKFSVLPIVFLGLLLSPCLATALTPQEHELRSAFIYNFIRFTKRSKNSGPIELCVFGSEESLKAIRTLHGRVVNKRSISVSAPRLGNEIARCEVAFISSISKKHELNLLKDARGHGLLTIGDSKGFCEAGGILRLFLVDARVRFQINIDVARDEKVHFDPKMLQLANSIIDNGKQ
jgi:hypothetical protein